MTAGPDDRRARGLASAFGLYVLIAILWYAPASLSPHDTVPDVGDPLHIAYILAWDAHQLPRDPLALYESNSFFPYSRSLAFSEHLLPEAILVAPINWITGNAVLAANVAALLGLALSAFTMCLLVRKWTDSLAAGFLAGIVYAFTAFTRHEAPRLHLLHAQWWPLALLFLTRFSERGRRRDAWGAVASLALQGLSCTYYFVFAVFVVPFWLVGVYVCERRSPGRSEVVHLALAAGTIALATGLVLLPFVRHYRAMGFEKSLTAGIDLLSYLLPDAKNPWLGWITPGAPGAPHFLGFVTMSLATIGVFAHKSRLRWIAAATAGIGLALSFGPGVAIGERVLFKGPYGLLHDSVPLARGMSSPERFSMVGSFGAAVLAGLGAAAVLSRLSRPSIRRAVLVVAVLAALGEQWTPSSEAFQVPTAVRASPVNRFLASQGDGALVELPIFPDRLKRFRSLYLFFSTQHWRPTSIGRTSFYPPAHDRLVWELRDFPDEASIELLSRLSLRTIVVHPRLWEEPMRTRHLNSLDSDPRLRLISRFEAQQDQQDLGLGDERVYEIVKAGQKTLPSCLPSDAVPRADWSFQSSGRKRPELTIDGDRSTAWFTRDPQRPGDFLQVHFGEAREISAIKLEVGSPYEEFPRNLQVEAVGTDGGWEPWPFDDSIDARWSDLQALLERPRDAGMILRLTPRATRGIRLSIARRGWDDAWPQWRIAELRLFRTCR